jgi:transcription antitermination factor NusG
MDFWQKTNWFAIQTKPYQENLAAARVASLDADVFLPRVKQEQMICGFARLVNKPLFPGYFFAQFCPLLSYEAVRYTHGVLRVVGTRLFPIPLEAEVMLAIQNRVQEDGFIRLQRKRFLPGEKVTIEKGPFADWMGEVERELDDGRRVSILLEAIQQARVLIEKRWLAATPVVA